MHNIQSPRTDDAGIEAQLASSPAPRVTLADIENAIVNEEYFTAADGVSGNIALRLLGSGVSVNSTIRAHADDPLNLLTFCVLVLRNGYTVVGESACASPENFDAAIGRRIARENAVQKIWPLMGYTLKNRLAAQHDLFTPV